MQARTISINGERIQEALKRIEAAENDIEAVVDDGNANTVTERLLQRAAQDLFWVKGFLRGLNDHFLMGDETMKSG